MAQANLVKIIREALGISMQEAGEMLERQGATERTPTKRELFAAMTLQGLVANASLHERSTGKSWALDTPDVAVRMADLLIAELEKNK